MGAAVPGSRLERMHDAQQLIQRLVRAGWTHSRIADAMGLSYRPVSDWVHGRRAPKPGQLEKLRKLAEAHH
jgi:transcriptional regulator with XRE-family HTH domain